MIDQSNPKLFVITDASCNLLLHTRNLLGENFKFFCVMNLYNI